MGIELINDKKKIVLYLNTILIISFIWVIFVNTSYFFEKTVFGEHELYSDLKLIHNKIGNDKNTLKFINFLLDTYNIEYIWLVIYQ